MKKIVVVFGTRPEAIKICPLIVELKKIKQFETIVVVTGQHKQMLEQVLSTFDVSPNYDLSIMKAGQDLFDITENVLHGMKKIFCEIKPDLVIVHGDTTTSLASAMAAYYMKIRVAHVEAGLRTYDKDSPYPEEFNRHCISILADLNFAPTEWAKQNLLKERIDEKSIWVTGNTVIDALKTTIKEEYRHPELEWCKGKKMVLVTAHRRENIGEPMRCMFQAIKQVLNEHSDVRAIFPVHLNPKVREICKDVFSIKDNIHIIEPLDVIDFHNFMNASYLILTDSGGIQEEAPSLDKPVLVMRNTTERPEAVQANAVKVIGTSKESVYKEFSRLLDDKDEYYRMSKAVNPYGDGRASKRIADVITHFLSR